MRSDTAFEPRDLRPVPVVVTALGVFLGALLLTGLLWFYFEFLKDRTGRLSEGRYTGVVLPPEPRPEADAEKYLDTYLNSQKATVHRYAWVDRAKGIATIPVESAIDIIARRGIPPVAPSRDLQLSMPARGDKNTGLSGTVVEPTQ